ncbi:hypothetical protein A0H76_747 [Hepatospora eriocheir]|uniref:Small ribosomal subunit protein uS10 domain-containing protein n=1 Tax=Hepatospora eriocheir TaxID=1081669 RepID=A0A1X0QL16_9MICR|nr:hypothetical protein A0H76_747 [Hepatospora eriocheir]
MLQVEESNKLNQTPVQAVETENTVNISVKFSSLDKSKLKESSLMVEKFLKNLGLENFKLTTNLKPAQAEYTSRKSPCGNGTASWTKRTMRIFQADLSMTIEESVLSTVSDFFKGLCVKSDIIKCE